MRMKKFFVAIFILLLTFFFVSFYFYYRWKPLWSFEKPREIYSIIHHQDDTLRVVMIGDSWVGMRSDTINRIFEDRLSAFSGRPVKLKTRGKGGEKSRGIYCLMYEDEGPGTKPLLLDGADYCVVIAGINDAAANLGTKQYVYHMKLVLNQLLANDIRPVLVEIPDVNIWNVYSGKPVKDLILDYTKSVMTGCQMYSYSEYRKELFSMVLNDHMLNQIIYVPMNCWNGDDCKLNSSLFMEDMIHLNHYGYERLDDCVVVEISKDLKQMQDSTFLNDPVGKDSQQY